MASVQISARVEEHVRAKIEALATSLNARLTDALELAVEGWEAALQAAAEDNARAFAPEEWCLIADVCNGTLWYPLQPNAAYSLAANIEDGHRLDGAGYKWLADEETELAGSLARAIGAQQTQAMRRVDKEVGDLVKRLAALGPAHAWAVILAVLWFWNHCQEDIDVRKDPWWTLQYRRQHARKAGGS